MECQKPGCTGTVKVDLKLKGRKVSVCQKHIVWGMAEVKRPAPTDIPIDIHHEEENEPESP